MDSFNYTNTSINFTNLYQDYQILRDDLLFIDQTDSYHNYSFSDGSYYVFQYITAQTICSSKVNLIISEYGVFGEILGLLIIVSIGLFMLRSADDDSNMARSTTNLKQLGSAIVVIAIMIAMAVIALVEFGGVC